MPNNNEISLQCYDIMPDGCLNGLFINLETGDVYNEIAKKIYGSLDSIVGNYNCCYIDSNDSYICSLSITQLPNKKFHFDWASNGNTDWLGEGWLIKPNQLIVKYWKP